MATTTRKGSDNKKAKLRRPMVNTSVAEQAQTIAELRQQLAESLQREEARDKKLQERDRQLAEALEQQTSTNEILRIIANSATDLQPVLDAVAENAGRLIDAQDVIIHRLDGDVLRDAAHYGLIPRTPDTTTPLTRDSVAGRAAVDRQLVHVTDLQAESDAEFPLAKARAVRDGTRSILTAPLRHKGELIGALNAHRNEVRPFTPVQIKLLETFADQAVIAIENVRLFNELKESLEQQTATSEILSVIASSPTDIQPVFQTILDNAVLLCEAQNGAVFRFDGEVFRAAVWNNISPALDSFVQSTPIPPGRESALRRVGLEKRPVHIPDMLADSECIVPEPYREEGMRTNLAVPLLKENDLIGAIAIHRQEVRPFTENQIRLLETLDHQAVIAVENLRLFQELKESLEQQTATSEVLGVIASSPTDIQPVLDAVAESAARLCSATDAVIRLVEGSVLRLAAHQGPIPFSFAPSELPINRSSVTGRAVVEGQPVHIEDLVSVAATEFPEINAVIDIEGGRTQLAVPLMREGLAIGAILIRRTTVDPFTDKQIALLKTFADQAVIAIENVRLFKEIQERNAELREALEHQTATSEVLGIISRSPTDVQPVLDAIVESAARVCGIDDMTLRLRDGNHMVARAHFGLVPPPPSRVDVSIDAPEFCWIREHGTLHISDIRAHNEFPFLGSRGYMRSLLTVPLCQQGGLIGSLTAMRCEVRPFTPAQIKLLETFADQAVIAIENVRLFNELKESLAQQTATSEILGVIASSPTDIQPVLDAIAQSAARVCGSDDATIRRTEEDTLFLVAHYGTIPPGLARRPLASRTPNNEAILQRKTVHIFDVLTEAERFPDSSWVRDPHDPRGIRTFLVTPLLREGVPIGVIVIRRTEVKPFTDKQVALLETFAAQAVIAIENVRLFKELQERNAELREALEHQTATAEVLSIISRSPTDVQPVLDAIVESAAQVCGIDDVVLRLHEGDKAIARAHFGPIPIARV